MTKSNILNFSIGVILFIIPYVIGRYVGKSIVKRKIRNYINEQRWNKYMGIHGLQIPDYLTRIEEELKEI
jgi:hypothetical protein